MFEYKDLRVCTLNVNSIVNETIRHQLFAWLRSRNDYDIIALQELAVSSSMPQARKDKWKKEWNAPMAISDECAILINNKRLSIHNTQEFLQGRILSVDIACDNDINNTIRLVNVYAPSNNNRGQAKNGQIRKTPQEFVDLFPTAAINTHPLKIVVGDFNTIKDNNLDRSPPSQRCDASKWHLYAPLFDRLGIVDSAPSAPRDEDGTILETHFTHIHNRAGNRLMTRIDYIFVSRELSASSYRVTTAPIVESDHRLVSATINLGNARPRKPRTFAAPSLDTRILSDAGFRKEIRAALKTLIEKRASDPLAFESVGTFWDACKKKFLLLGQQHRNKKRNSNRRQRTRLQQALKEADRKLDSNPNDPIVIESHMEALNSLDQMEKDHLDRIATMAKVKWIEEGERPSPYFTQKLKSGRERKAIVSLQDGSGASTSDAGAMAEIAHAFYTNLYKSQPTDRRAQDELLECVTKTVSEGTRASLDEDLTFGEIRKSISTMDNRSSPGSDGLPYEFYKTFKDDVTPILAELFNSITGDSGSLAPSHHFALTTLIFKKGDQEQMKNYRPISLTQTDYKIFTKAITNRFNKAANQVVEKWQTGFIPGRQGHDNVMMLELLAQHVEDGSRGEAMLLSLDQEKAYDRVEWDYLHRVLEKFGFGPRVRNWIRCSYTNLSASILLNGVQSAPYMVERGLRQGDPLAPILFNLVLEPFLLFYDLHAKGVETVAEPVKVGAFADDTILGLRPGDEGVALRAIRLHERASGAKINSDKTEMIPLTAGAMEAFQFPSFEWLPFGTSFKHLGVMIQPTGRVMAPIEQGILQDLRQTVSAWNLRRLSFSGRVTVANTYFLSKLWHVAPFYELSESFFKEVDMLTKKLLWDGRTARVSLDWFHRPHALGGWNLINVRSQCAALKSKWLARWKNEDLRWKNLFTHMARRTFEFPSQPATIDFLQAPLPARAKKIDLVNQTPIIRMSTQSFSSLNITTTPGTPQTGPETFYAGKNPVAEFQVKIARRYLDKEKLAARVARPTPKTIRLQPPVFKNLRLKNIAVDAAGVETETDIPDKQWNNFFQRLHASQRYTKEKDFLYLYVHKVIQTNGVKSKYEYTGEDKTKPACRRCQPDPNDPAGEPAFETRRHAFFECPPVHSLWRQVREWLTQLRPNMQWSDDPNQTLLCWPEHDKIHPIAVHMHSVASNTVWRTYCKLGDKEDLYKNQLHWMVFFSFQHRAKIEHARAMYLDEKRREECITAQQQLFLSEDPDQNYDKMKLEWHIPPHITVSKSGVTFGEMWDTLPEGAGGGEVDEEE